MDFEDEEVARCPTCNKVQCEHVFARLDRTFACCEAGALESKWTELEDTLRAVLFERLSTAKKRRKLVQADGVVEAMWREAMSHFLPSHGPADVRLEGDALVRIVMDALRAIGVDEREDNFEGGPGMSSVTTVFYAEDHEDVFESLMYAVLARLYFALQPRRTPKRATPARRRARASRGG